MSSSTSRHPVPPRERQPARRGASHAHGGNWRPSRWHRDAVLEVDATVAIEVDGVVPDAAGQKLWQTDRSGERTVVLVGCAALLLRHQEQVFEFAAKQFGARRIVEGERGKGVEQLEIADIPAVDRFHPDDSHDDSLVHRESLGRSPNRLPVVFPEFDAGLDADRFDESGSISLPGPNAGFCGGRM